MPLTATDAAVASDAPSSTICFVRSTSSPKDCAESSPSDMRSRSREQASNNPLAASVKGSAIQTWTHARLSRPPISQNMTSAATCQSTKLIEMSRDVAALNNEPQAIPAKTSVATGVTPPRVASAYTNRPAPKAPTKLASGSHSAE